MMEEIKNKLPGPGYSNSLSWGWSTMKWAFLPLFLVFIVLVVIDWPLELIGNRFRDHHEGWLYMIEHPGAYWALVIEVLALAYWLLLVPVFEYSANLLFVHAARRQRPDVREIVAGFRNYVSIVLANLLTIALVGIALVAFIIPGIIVACRLAFVSYLVMDKNLDPVAAVETSWKMTRGHGWKIFALGFTSIFIFIGGLLLFFVGVIPAVIWIKSTFASLYESVLQENETD